MRSRAARRRVLASLLVLAVTGVFACVTPSGPPPGPRTLAEAAEEAPSPERRASIRLVERAHEALKRGELGTAEILAERALRVDGRNPYAYLVLGETAARGEAPDEALRHLERAEGLFEAEAPESRLFRARGLYAQADLLERSSDQAAAEVRRRRATDLLEGRAW